MEKFGGYKVEVKEIMEEEKRLALRNKVKEERSTFGDVLLLLFSHLLA